MKEILVQLALSALKNKAFQFFVVKHITKKIMSVTKESKNETDDKFVLFLDRNYTDILNICSRESNRSDNEIDDILVKALKDYRNR